MLSYNDYGYTRIGIDYGGPTATDYTNNSIILRLGDRKVVIPQGSHITRVVQEIEYNFNEQLRYQQDKIYNNIKNQVLYPPMQQVQPLIKRDIKEDEDKQKLKDLIAHYYSKG